MTTGCRRCPRSHGPVLAVLTNWVPVQSIYHPCCCTHCPFQCFCPSLPNCRMCALLAKGPHKGSSSATPSHAPGGIRLASSLVVVSCFSVLLPEDSGESDANSSILAEQTAGSPFASTTVSKGRSQSSVLGAAKDQRQGSAWARDQTQRSLMEAQRGRSGVHCPSRSAAPVSAHAAPARRGSSIVAKPRTQKPHSNPILRGAAAAAPHTSTAATPCPCQHPPPPSDPDWNAPFRNISGLPEARKVQRDAVCDDIHRKLDDKAEKLGAMQAKYNSQANSKRRRRRRRSSLLE